MQAERRGEMDLRFAKWQVSPVTSNQLLLEPLLISMAEWQAGREQKLGECKCGSNGGKREWAESTIDLRRVLSRERLPGMERTLRCLVCIVR